MDNKQIRKNFIRIRNIYDFVIDYEEILLLKAIYDMHRYLMIKHDAIIP